MISCFLQDLAPAEASDAFFQKNQLTGIRWPPRHTASFSNMELLALHRFDESLEKCKNLEEADIFIKQQCKLCNTYIKKRGHPASQTHRRRLICRNLLRRWEEIQTKTTIEQLKDLLEQISAELIKTDPGKPECLLCMTPKSSFWHDKYISGSHDSRQMRLPDGAKLWLKMYLTDLSVLIRSLRKSQDCASLSSSVSVSDTLDYLESTIAKVMPSVRPAPSPPVCLR